MSGTHNRCSISSPYGQGFSQRHLDPMPNAYALYILRTCDYNKARPRDALPLVSMSTA